MPEDLLKFGMIPEFIGRLPVITSVQKLDREALINILTEPKNALVRQYRRLFELDGVELEFTDDALEAIADQAILRRSEEHTSELQSRQYLVCRLLLEKKKI